MANPFVRTVVQLTSAAVLVIVVLVAYCAVAERSAGFVVIAAQIRSF